MKALKEANVVKKKKVAPIAFYIAKGSTLQK